MFKWIVFLSSFLFGSTVYAQKQTIDFDSIQKKLHKTYKGSLKIFVDRFDSAVIVVGYKKSTHELNGVQILVRSRDSFYPSLSQYAFYFLAGDTVLLKVFAGNGKHTARAKYLYIANKLISKEENKYVEQDYTNLIVRSDSYKQLAFQLIKEKFRE